MFFLKIFLVCNYKVLYFFRVVCIPKSNYADYLGVKFDGKNGILERKHIPADSIIYVGKEANIIDEQALDVKRAQEFTD